MNINSLVMKKVIFTLLILAVALFCEAQSGSITNILVSQRTNGSGLVDIYFTLEGSGSNYNIIMETSFDAGNTFTLIQETYLDSVSGISPGDNIHLIWDGLGSFPNIYSEESMLKIIAYEEGTCPPLIPDVDGNAYNTAIMGTQCWMTVNLETTQYSNGTPIDYPGTDDTEWSNTTNGAYAWYDNDISWKDSYGALYNWYAVEDTNGLCPEGWHVPAENEWAKIIEYVGIEEIAGGKMKSTRTEPDDHPRWDDPNTGATNESNWSGLPGGAREFLGGFGFSVLGTKGEWWSPTIVGTYPRYYSLTNSTSSIYLYNDRPFNCGLSVRCVWNDSVEATLPEIITKNVIAVGWDTAWSGGNIINTGGASVTARGIVWSIQEQPTLENNQGFTVDGEGAGEFESRMGGLTSQTFYYVRAYATNSVGTEYGQQESFETLIAPGAPIVITDAVSDISYNTATSGGNVIDGGAAEVEARGVVWATFQNPTLENYEGFTEDGSGLGEYTSYLIGLTAGTQYYVRAYAMNFVATSYGNQADFNTLDPVLATVTTETVSDITYCSATSGGNVTDDGFGAITARGVVWATFQNPALENNEGFTTDGSGLGEFISYLSGLSQQTQYYVRAYATNSAGNAYGNQEEFVTEPFICGTTTITDIDNNVYNTVLVGSQCWMQENLETTKYSDGTPIEYPGTDNNAWSNNTTGAYAWYDNDISWKDLYGALYNYHAAFNTNGLCPEGWHIPSNSEWDIIINLYTEIAGRKMKSTRTDPDTHPRWDSPNYADNESEWTGFPGGEREFNGSFSQLGDKGHWMAVPLGYSPLLEHDTEYMGGSEHDSNCGLSIRCLKDE